MIVVINLRQLIGHSNRSNSLNTPAITGKSAKAKALPQWACEAERLTLQFLVLNQPTSSR